jgi:predicted O-linked N-acetylglucosamine transferase (SPINDLY family)
MGASVLTAAGLGTFITESRLEYAAAAARLAADASSLVETRSTLRERLLRSPLTDATRFARHFEDLLLKAWDDRVRRDAGAAH